LENWDKFISYISYALKKSILEIPIKRYIRSLNASPCSDVRGLAIRTWALI